MKEKLKWLRKSLLKSFLIALIVIVVVSIGGIVYALIRGENVTPSYAIIPNYVAGVILIFAGLGHVIPAATGTNTMTNSANAAWRIENMRENKGNIRSLFAFIGGWVIIIAGATDFVYRM